MLQWLSPEAPDRFTRIFSRYYQGVHRSRPQYVRLVYVCGWLNRLKIALGEKPINSSITERALAAPAESRKTVSRSWLRKIMNISQDNPLPAQLKQQPIPGDAARRRGRVCHGKGFGFLGG